MEFYVQDTWKCAATSRSISASAGSCATSPSEASNLIASPNQTLVYGAAPTYRKMGAGQTILQAGLEQPGTLHRGRVGSVRQGQDLGPRQLPHRLRPAAHVRALHDFQTLPGITLGVTNTTFGQNGGRLANLPKITPPNVAPGSLAQPAAYSTNTVTVVDPNLETATTHMWSFGIQREILPRTVLSVDYMGRRAYNLYGSYNANQPEIFRNGFFGAFKAAQAGRRKPAARPVDALRLPPSGSRIWRGLPAPAIPHRAVAELGRRGCPESGSAIREPPAASASAQRRCRRTGPYYFFPFPQFGQVRVIDSNDFSTYHGLEVQILRRMSQRPRSAVQLDLVEVPRHALLRPVAHNLRNRHGTVGDIAAFRPRQSQAELCPLRLRPPARLEFLLDLGVAVRRNANRTLKSVSADGRSPDSCGTRQAGRTPSSPARTRSPASSRARCSATAARPDGHVFTNAAGIIQFIDQATRDKMTHTRGDRQHRAELLQPRPDLQHGCVARQAIPVTEKIEFQVRADDEPDQYPAVGRPDSGSDVGKLGISPGHWNHRLAEESQSGRRLIFRRRTLSL